DPDRALVEVRAQQKPARSIGDDLNRLALQRHLADRRKRSGGGIDPEAVELLAVPAARIEEAAPGIEDQRIRSAGERDSLSPSELAGVRIHREDPDLVAEPERDITDIRVPPHALRGRLLTESERRNTRGQSGSRQGAARQKLAARASSGRPSIRLTARLSHSRSSPSANRSRRRGRRAGARVSTRLPRAVTILQR